VPAFGSKAEALAWHNRPNKGNPLYESNPVTAIWQCNYCHLWHFRTKQRPPERFKALAAVENLDLWVHTNSFSDRYQEPFVPPEELRAANLKHDLEHGDVGEYSQSKDRSLWSEGRRPKFSGGTNGS